MTTQMLRGIQREDESQILMASIVLPEQFYTSPFVTYAKRPEALLLRAVLENALGCFQSQFTSPSTRNQRLAREAETWFASDATDWPCTFVNICMVFDLDPSYLRARLKQWQGQRPQALRLKKRRMVIKQRIETRAA